MQVNVQGYPILCQSRIGPLLYSLLLQAGIGSPSGNSLCLTFLASKNLHFAGFLFNYHSFYFSTTQPLVGFKFLIFPTIPPLIQYNLFQYIYYINSHHYSFTLKTSQQVLSIDRATIKFMYCYVLDQILCQILCFSIKFYVLTCKVQITLTIKLPICFMNCFITAAHIIMKC